MEHFIKLGEDLLRYSDVVGDFLLSTPLGFVADSFKHLISSGIKDANWFDNLIIMICEQSIATWIVSGAITGVLIYRLIKFFVGLITGS